ncbi:hypothetical protein DFH94DRAFT_640741 [Russula ochroleuca]|uniref:NADAR domain-containing protein n=1 Tax=Russula ochroleuca TaxID=152965 RepID=A0A9P5JV22_9AGAM|nr:hypothetical protein DFH94DRAFT_640741 [Russula ochroleuca]
MQVFSDTNSTHSIGAGFPFPTPMTGGSTSVPSSAVRRGDPAQTPLTTPSVIKLDGYGDFPGLLHYSPHSVLYEDKQYPTALHLFEACKFLPDWPDLADRVRQCQHIDQVTSTSAGLANFIRPDWGNVMLSTMDEVVYLKFRQHDDLRTLLLNTYPAELVYVESGDLFWGGDGAGDGMNELGKSLMRVRERLRSEEGTSMINVQLYHDGRTI